MGRSNKLSKREFDAIIKDNLIAAGVTKDSFGYRTDNDRTYYDYYTEAEFKRFVDEMKADYAEHYKKYYGDEEAKENRGGLGGELLPKRGRWGMLPPKMASVASSSRFCYLALRDGTDALISNRILTRDDVEFEKECRIFADGSTAPQLDAFIKDTLCDYYVEAKCHEIFDSHEIEFKHKYWEIFQNDKSFCHVLKDAIKHTDTFEIPKAVFELWGEHMRFDVKQLVCHLFGIANQARGRQSKLFYLFFKLKSEDPETALRIEVVFEELKNEIEFIFGSDVIKGFCAYNQIGLEVIVQECNVMKKLDTYNSRKVFS